MDVHRQFSLKKWDAHALHLEMGSHGRAAGDWKQGTSERGSGLHKWLHQCNSLLQKGCVRVYESTCARMCVRRPNHLHCPRGKSVCFIPQKSKDSVVEADASLDGVRQFWAFQLADSWSDLKANLLSEKEITVENAACAREKA